MITKDLLIYESGSGGELSVQNGDLAMIEYLYNQPLLAMFGGNIGGVTKGNEPAGTIRQDWWANALLFPNDPGSQFNSTTELAVQNNALNSIGRVNIQRAAESDMAYLKSIADITVNVVILAVNKVQIIVLMQQPGNNISVSVKLIWDNAKNELITERIL